MTLYEKYCGNLYGNHCPTIEELSQYTGKPTEEVIQAVSSLWLENKLSSDTMAFWFWEKARLWTTRKPYLDHHTIIDRKDVLIICNYLDFESKHL